RTSPATRCRRPSSSSMSYRARRPENHRSSRSVRRNGLDTAAGSRDERACERINVTASTRSVELAQRGRTMSTDMLADATYTEDALNTTAIGRSLGTDYFGLRDELTDAERDYLRRTRAF